MIQNERVKLAANSGNAIGLALFAIAVLRPVIEIGSDDYRVVPVWAAVGLALHGLAHYILGHMR
jgi:hypothetical protein